ncbi:MAG: DUF5916 domain-containing protein [Vicinamibacterales bacterium]
MQGLTVAGLVVVLSVCAQQSPLFAQSARPELKAHRLAEGETIAVDGAPDEGVWTLAQPATDFRQRDPDNGSPATERTEVRVVFDDNRLILGVTCFDSEPTRLLGNQMQRDAPFSSDDRFLMSIDPFMNGRTGYFFEINPSGAMGDGLITGPTGGPGGGGGRGGPGGGGGGGGGGGFGGGMNKSWDGIWLARVQRSDIGWTAEIEIPFKTLNFDPHATGWGANFQRTVKRKNEESLWTGWLRDEGLTRMSNAGRIDGLQNLSQGLGLDLKPYAIGAAGNAPGRGVAGTTSDYDAGLDFFYNLTPALKANFTLNTDFAETEVDQRRTNLTRFPLFFPEKREFFLDGANFFDFPPGDSSPFFSRRIGLNSGQPQPITYGAKLIGQVGKQDVGVLHMSTSVEDYVAGGATVRLEGDDFTVARVKRRIGSQSSVGLLYTRRDTRDSIIETRQTSGADVTVATPRFLGDKTLDSGFWFLHTTKPTFVSASGERPPEGGANGYGWRVNVAKDPWRTGLTFREFQQAYDAAVGFTPRRNVRRWNPQAHWNPRLRNHPFIRGLQFELGGDVNTNLRNQLIDRTIRIAPFEMEFHSGDRVQVQVMNEAEQLFEDFEIHDGVVLPAGMRSDWLRYQVNYNAASRRPISGRVEYSWGGFWTGTRSEFTVDVNLRPRQGVYLQLSTEVNDVDLPEGSFTTRLYRFDARTQFSPWLSLSNNMQYDSVSGTVGWQLSFRWIQKPGDDLYFVWTQNWFDDEGRGFQVLDRRGAAKIVKTLRF